jgi:superfamily II DNA or RNA helicase
VVLESQVNNLHLSQKNILLKQSLLLPNLVRVIREFMDGDANQTGSEDIRLQTEQAVVEADIPDDVSFLEFHEGTLTLNRWSKVQIEQFFGNQIWKWDDRSRLWRTLANQYSLINKTMRERRGEAPWAVIDCVPRWQSVAYSKDETKPLRTEQQQALESWFEQQNGILVMPTGTGKTEVALQAMIHSRCSTLIVAPIRDLMYQWHRRILHAVGYDAGIIGDNTYHVKPISVTTYDSACIHMPKLGDRFQFLIFDECHHLPGAIRADAARMSIATKRLGLTATLDRNSTKSDALQELIGPVVYELSIQEVRGKSLAEYDVFRIRVHLQPEERRRYDELATTVAMYVYERRQDDESFQWQQLYSEAAEDSRANRVLIAHREKQAIEDRAAEKLRVIDDLLCLHHGTPMIIFAGSNRMAREVSMRFLIPCLLSHCGKKERLDYLDGLRDGVYPAIVANQILDEGVDIPAVKIAIVIGGLASNRQSQQRLGRILRKTGNERAILYEVVCQDTNEVLKSRKRRKNDAYARTRYFKDHSPGDRS